MTVDIIYNRRVPVLGVYFYLKRRKINPTKIHLRSLARCLSITSYTVVDPDLGVYFYLKRQKINPTKMHFRSLAQCLSITLYTVVELVPVYKNSNNLNQNFFITNQFSWYTKLRQ